MAGCCNFNEPKTWKGHEFACGSAVTYFTKLDESFERTGETLRHEAGGHGFAKLADEYHYSGTLSTSDKELIERRSAYMWYSNVDITSDPAKIKWAHSWLMTATKTRSASTKEVSPTSMAYGVLR